VRKKRMVIVSGAFDPIHVGHVRLMRDAASKGDELVIILNNNVWVKKKKSYIFMSQVERKEILLSMNCVSKVIVTMHKKDSEDISVCTSLKKIYSDFGKKYNLIFANGGDKKKHNIPEYDLCEQLGIKMIFGMGGRQIQHSSELIEKIGLL